MLATAHRGFKLNISSYRVLMPERLWHIQSLLILLLVGGIVLLPQQAAHAASTCAGFIANPVTSVAELITAIDQANGTNCPGADTIDLGGNTITFTSSSYTYVSEAVALPGVTTPITITNGTLTRSSASAFKFLFVDTTGSLTIDHMTVSNGGGALSRGGAIHARGDLTITNSTFSNNTASGYAGGAIFVENASSSPDLIVTDSTFDYNQSLLAGGAIHTQDAASITITRSVFYGNTTSEGAALYIGENNTTTIITNSLFTGNRASGAAGAIENRSGAFTLRNSTIAGNKAGGQRGRPVL